MVERAGPFCYDGATAQPPVWQVNHLAATRADQVPSCEQDSVSGRLQPQQSNGSAATLQLPGRSHGRVGARLRVSYATVYSLASPTQCRHVKTPAGSATALMPSSRA
eukprot:236843-Chlamydomonas_euryale.AAC.1